MKTLEKTGTSPAPWECIRNRDGGMDIVDGENNLIAEVLSDDAHDNSDGEMMAAAPNLYFALSMMLSHATTLSPRAKGMMSGAINVAYDALEKAGGAA